MFGWGAEKPKKTVKRYIEALNSRNLAEIGKILHKSIRYIDSKGCWIQGRADAMVAMDRFFAMEPNFRVIPKRLVAHDGEVLITGRCEAEDDRLTHNTLWRTRAEYGCLLLWQSYGTSQAPALARILSPDTAQSYDAPNGPGDAERSRATNSY